MTQRNRDPVRAELSPVGPVLTQARLVEGRVQRTYSALLAHLQGCVPCRVDGIDCTSAASLRTSWRQAKADAK